MLEKLAKPQRAYIVMTYDLEWEKIKCEVPHNVMSNYQLLHSKLVVRRKF